MRYSSHLAFFTARENILVNFLCARDFLFLERQHRVEKCVCKLDLGSNVSSWGFYPYQRTLYGFSLEAFSASGNALNQDFKVAVLFGNLLSVWQEQGAVKFSEPMVSSSKVFGPPCVVRTVVPSLQKRKLVVIKKSLTV